MSVNDKFDMTVFDGTKFEGMTYLQVRRRMTPAQVLKFKSLNKRSRAVEKHQRACYLHALTYRG